MLEFDKLTIWEHNYRLKLLVEMKELFLSWTGWADARQLYIKTYGKEPARDRDERRRVKSRINAILEDCWRADGENVHSCQGDWP